MVSYRAQGFIVKFDKSGVVVLPVSEEEEKWELKMELLPKKVEENSGRISTEKNKIEIGRGNVTEWYINEESGLEQGFTIYEPFHQGIFKKLI